MFFRILNWLILFVWICFLYHIIRPQAIYSEVTNLSKQNSRLFIIWAIRYDQGTTDRNHSRNPGPDMLRNLGVLAQDRLGRFKKIIGNPGEKILAVRGSLVTKWNGTVIFKKFKRTDLDAEMDFYYYKFSSRRFSQD